MGRKLGLLGILLLLPALAASAAAQVQTGSIHAKVTDEQGASVPGATLTLTSPVLPQALVGVSDSTGIYQFQALRVGTYTIRTTLTGFQSVTRESILVLQNQTATIEFSLKVSSIAQEVTVVATTPVVDTKSANVNVNLDAKLLDTTPGGKDIWNILEYKVPGLIFDTPDVGGNQGGLQRSFTARGTPNSQNVQLLNGVNVGDPAAIGFSMNYYEPSTFQNIRVSTGAQDISMGTSGTLVNMVTRSGTNQFGGLVLGTYQGQGTQWDNIDEDLKQQGFRPEAQAVGMISNFNVQAGGPVVRNRVFWFGSYNDQRTHVNVPGFPAVSPIQVPQTLSGSLQDSTDIASVSGKLTLSLNQSNRLEVYGNRQWYDKPNRGADDDVTLDSNTREYDTFPVVQASWSSVFRGTNVLETNLSYNNTHFPLAQKTNLQTIVDNSTGFRLRNAANTAMMYRRRLQITSNWTNSIPRLFGGRHDLKAGFDNAFTPEDVTTTRIDNVNLTWRSQQGTATQPPGPVNVTVFNSPLYVKRAVMNTALYAQDSFSINRLTVIAGVRWERVEGYLPEQEHPSSEYFPTGMLIQGLNVTLNTGGRLTEYTVPDRFAEVRNAPLWQNWAPRVSGTFDLTGRGRTIAKASWGKYLDQIGTGTPGPNPNGTVSQQYTWIDQNNDLFFQKGDATWDGFKYVGGEFGALQSTAIPNPNPFDPTLKRTYRNETTVGLDHELMPGLRTSATYIHRRVKNAQGTVDQTLEEWPNQFTQITVPEPGRDGVFNTADDATLTVYNRNPGVTQTTKTVNDNRLGDTYNGLELTVTKYYANGFTILGGYTYAHTTVELTSLANPNAAFVNAEGESGGRRHLFKATGSYRFPYDIVFGGNLRMQSGQPITRTYTVPGCSATVTVNCLSQGGTGVNAEPRGSEWLPALYTVDVRVGRDFLVNGRRVEFSMDVYNLANANTLYSVRTGTGLTPVFYADDRTTPQLSIPTFYSSTGILGPRIVRFNLTYSFGGSGGRR